MTQVAVVGEGQTEAAFVNLVLGPHLLACGVVARPRLIETSKTGRGGALSYDRVLLFLRNTLLEQANTYVTTFFDLYRLPSKFPGVSESSGYSDPIQRAKEIEAAFHTAVIEKTKCRPDRFLPHIQPYEFEALLYSDVSKFEEAEPQWRTHTDELRSALQSAGSPEHINDGDHTHPSARLKRLIPRYKKVSDGIRVSQKIGISRIRDECRHFDEWLQRLETLPPL